VCVIIHLSPNATMNKEHFYNAVYNNWHGYGVILKDGNGKLQVIKKFDPEGNNPDDIWKIIKDNEDIERFVHVRHCTKGAADEDNTQPFELFASDTRNVWFMHNGTLHNFGNFTANSGKSDTIDFCEKVLEPSLGSWVGPNGIGDYTDPVYQALVVDKSWNNSSKGLFVSNNLEPQRIGLGWSEYKHGTDTQGQIWVSNTEYFDRCQRGPMFQKRELERKAKEAEEKEKQKGQEVAVTVSKFPESPVKQWVGDNNKSFAVTKAVNDIINTFDLYDPKTVAKLKLVAYDEWVAIIEEQDDFSIAAVLEIFAEHIANLTVVNKALSLKKEKAEKKIEQLATQLKMKVAA